MHRDGPRLWFPRSRLDTLNRATAGNVSLKPEGSNMNRIARLVILATLVAPIVVVSPASADPPGAPAAPAPKPPTVPARRAFMQVPDIKGSVSEPSHAGWIEVSSFQWGVGRSTSVPTGASSDREGKTPSVSSIVVTKSTDSASPNLFHAAVTGQHFPQVVLEVLTRDGSKRYQFVLSDVLISSAKPVPGDRPTESLTLNFTKIEFRTTPTSGPSSSPLAVTYDIVSHESF